VDTESQQPGPGLYTLTDAAALTGLTVEAIRLRIKRGKLASERGNDGRPRVRLTTADLEAFRQPKPTVGEQKAELTEQEPTDRGQTETVLAFLDLVDRTLARVDAAQAAAAEARARAAVAEGQVAELREALARSEARVTATEQEVSRLRARSWWARLRNLP
jgi:chromosome segregation ATPase